VQVGGVVVALLAGAVFGGNGGPLILVFVLMFALIVVLAVRPEEREPLWPRSTKTSWPLAALTVVGAGPWSCYGTSMFLSRQPPKPTDEILYTTLGINHYPVQG
jgi:hypothetical protein